MKKDKTEAIITCKYEKLGDFCFIYGLLSHTERFCKKKLEADNDIVTKDWGHWLRTPPRRAGAGCGSKWLIDDSDWGRQEGMNNHKADNQGFQKAEFTRPIDRSRFQRDNVMVIPDKSGYLNFPANNIQSREGNSNNIKNNGLDSEELYGLSLVERKRQRNEAHFTGSQIKQTDGLTNDSTLSTDDCVETSSHLLAKLVKQASQLQ